MNSQDIKDKIASGLNSLFTQESFKFKKSTNEFIRIKENYGYYFCIDQLKWSDHFSINVRIYITENHIEDTLEKILGKQRFRLTLGGDIATIKFSSDGRKLINQTLSLIIIFEKDIEAAIETLCQYYMEIAKPFFERHSSLSSIDDIINNEPYNQIPAYFDGNFDYRCMKGLIVAKMVKNPRYNELTSIYDKEMEETFKDFKMEAIVNYFKVKDYLQINDLIAIKFDTGLENNNK